LLGDAMWAGRDADRTETAIGSIGRLKLSDSIHVRVSTQGKLDQPLLLYEASYDEFSFGNWRARKSQFAHSDAISPGNVWPISDIPGATEHLTIRTKRKRELTVVPIPYGTTRVIDADILDAQRSNHGTVKLEMPPGQVSYEVDYRPGNVNRGIPPSEQDLKLPFSYAKDFDKIASDLGIANAEPSMVIARIETFFSDNFTYSLVQRSRWPGRMPLTSFLTKTRSGHCEYFATSTVLLLRAAGIPARYAVGYSVDEYSRIEGSYVARARHAHSWAEAYLNGQWQVVDTTPGIWAALEDEHASGWQGLLDTWSWLSYRFDRLRNGDSGLENYYVWLLIPLIVILGWRLSGRTRVQTDPHRKKAVDEQRRGTGRDSEFLQLVRQLDEMGYTLRPGEPLGAWLGRLELNSESRALVAPIRALLELHYRYRFDPQGIDSDERQKLSAAVATTTLSLSAQT